MASYSVSRSGNTLHISYSRRGTNHTWFGLKIGGISGKVDWLNHSEGEAWLTTRDLNNVIGGYEGGGWQNLRPGTYTIEEFWVHGVEERVPVTNGSGWSFTEEDRGSEGEGGAGVPVVGIPKMYGRVNDWINATEAEILACKAANIDYYEIELSGWGRYFSHFGSQEWRDAITSNYPRLLQLCRTHLKGGLFVSIYNDNMGLRKHGSNETRDANNSEVYSLLTGFLFNLVKNNGSEKVVVQPVAETRTRGGSNFNNYCKSNLTGFKLCYNGNGYNDMATPPAGWDYVSPHPSKVKKVVKSGPKVWPVSDHGSILKELNLYENSVINKEKAQKWYTNVSHSLCGMCGFYHFKRSNPDLETIRIIGELVGGTYHGGGEVGEGLIETFAWLFGDGTENVTGRKYMIGGDMSSLVPEITPDTSLFIDAYGDVSGSTTTYSEGSSPEISNLSIDTTQLTFNYSNGKDLSLWGITEELVSAMIYLKINGRWVGGEFSKIRSYQTIVSLENLYSKKFGWNLDNMYGKISVQFFISYNGRRTNTLNGKLDLGEEPVSDPVVVDENGETSDALNSDLIPSNEIVKPDSRSETVVSELVAISNDYNYFNYLSGYREYESNDIILDNIDYYKIDNNGVMKKVTKEEMTKNKNIKYYTKIYNGG